MLVCVCEISERIYKKLETYLLMGKELCGWEKGMRQP